MYVLVLYFVGTWPALCFFFFFFNDTATTEIYTLSLHDALPISRIWTPQPGSAGTVSQAFESIDLEDNLEIDRLRSEEHTSELQSPCNLVCRLLLEKKKNKVLCHTLSRYTHSWHARH